MFMRVATTQLWVHDQDEALEFWTKKVGFEVNSDVTVPEMGNFRWLSVNAPGQPDIGVVLMAVPGEPVMDDETRKEVLNLTAKGFCSTVFLTTDDVVRDYEALLARGVEFTQTPTQMPYGIDTNFRDPSGNNIRLGQLSPM
jgi:uncharacterized glyoxalase superfamily protein PhnB